MSEYNTLYKLKAKRDCVCRLCNKGLVESGGKTGSDEGVQAGAHRRFNRHRANHAR